MKRILLITLILGFLSISSVFADREIAVGPAFGFGKDTFSDRNYSYTYTGVYMDSYIGTKNIGLVSQGVIWGSPVSASYDSAPVNLANYNYMKIAQAFMLGLGYRTNIVEKIRIQASFGLGIHQVMLLSENTYLPELVTLMTLGPSVGLGAYYQLNDYFHVGLTCNADYAFNQAMSLSSEFKYNNGFTGNIGFVFGLKY